MGWGLGGGMVMGGRGGGGGEERAGDWGGGKGRKGCLDVVVGTGEERKGFRGRDFFVLSASLAAWLGRSEGGKGSGMRRLWLE